MTNEAVKPPSSFGDPSLSHAGYGFVAGKWTYRSYRDDPSFVGDDQAKALSEIFGEGAFSLTLSAERCVGGALDLGGGYFLDISGQVHGFLNRPPFLLYMIGTGRIGTATEGWEYDYQAYSAPIWPQAVNQIRALLGSVLRAKPHNGQPAGVTASFVMVAAGADPAASTPAFARAASPRGYQEAIRPKFRPGDIACMARRGVKLSDYAWMSDPAGGGGFADHANAHRVFDALSSGAMPPDTPWPSDWLLAYQDWMSGGFQL